LKSSRADLFARHLRSRIGKSSINISNEVEMQLSLEFLLSSIVPFEREFCFSAKDRVDFFVPALGVAIELKLARSGGSLHHVIQQLSRYAEHAKVEALILITTSYTLAAGMPMTLKEKPLYTIHIGGAF
jgi:REase_DpnII-MboI